MLLIISPSPIIVSVAIVVVVYSFPVFHSMFQRPIIKLTTAKYVYTLAMEKVLLPASNVNIACGVFE
jgi:hypothetical protein